MQYGNVVLCLFVLNAVHSSLSLSIFEKHREDAGIAAVFKLAQKKALLKESGRHAELGNATAANLPELPFLAPTADDENVGSDKPELRSSLSDLQALFDEASTDWGLSENMGADQARAFVVEQAMQNLNHMAVGHKIPSKFKVYVYKLPPAFNADLIKCYKDREGINVWENEGKELAQNTADIWLHYMLLQSDLLTEDPSKATVYYIPFYGFLSQEFSGINGHTNCNGEGHWQRMHDLAAWLSESKLFNDHPWTQVMTVSFWAVASETYPYWADENFAVIAGPLLKTMARVKLLVYEPMFGSFRDPKEYMKWEGPTVAIPYVANSALSFGTPLPATQARKYRLYFRGNLKLDSSHKSLSEGEKLRNRVFSAFQKLDGAHFEDSTENFSPEAYTNGMSNASFCLVPKGDTPTSRRLFDAIMAGCIPVIVSDGISLPFKDFVDWPSFSVRLDEDKVDAEGVYVKKYFDDHLSYHVIMSMRQKLDMYRDDFLYGLGDPWARDRKKGRALRNVFYAVLASDRHLLHRTERQSS